ncbi:hypothetical protein FRB94_005152 [Tulasnella sp. JGI-2019a]|nr:hypothetical protein FRB94_005152 [Tulasnella sp. JGI-2019a]KAG9017752.1 hypothetical protein FRB93_004563 [Tulasnella sp. JGI-2019a]
MPSQGVSTDPIAATKSHPPPGPNGAPSSSTSVAATNPEVEATVERLSSHKNVRGVMICSREGPIIRHTGAVFEGGDAGKKYAAVVKRIVDSVVLGLEEVNENNDELKFMRIRTRRHEIMISPDERYLLVVIQDPSL